MKAPAEGIGAETTNAAERVVLIVDDEPVNLQVLVNHLSVAGYGVLTAGSAREALDVLKSKKIPDLVLLDVMMPEISGFDLCSMLRERFSHYELPIIIVTAKKGRDDIIRGLQAGADDYITKPFDRNELLLRVKNYLDLKTAAEERRELSLINHELTIARDIQRLLFVKQAPQVENISVHTLYRPVGTIGGDFYDFHVIDRDRMGILIADVAGHGVPAALIGAMLKAVFYMLKEDARNPSVLLQRINTIFCEHSYGLFISANYTVIDARAKRVISSNAGHWPPIIIERDGGGLRKIFSRGKVLGFDREAEYAEAEAEITGGDRIIFYTDGLVECRNPAGDLYGEENFYRALKDCRSLPAADFIDALYGEAVVWAGSDTMEDDISLILIDLLG